MIQYKRCKKEDNINVNRKFLMMEDSKFTRQRYNKMYSLEVEAK